VLGKDKGFKGVGGRREGLLSEITRGRGGGIMSVNRKNFPCCDWRSDGEKKGGRTLVRDQRGGGGHPGKKKQFKWT